MVSVFFPFIFVGMIIMAWMPLLYVWLQEWKHQKEKDSERDRSRALENLR
jgi:hypothetical protein